MKKMLVVVLLVCLAGAVFSQSIDPSKIDFSNAKLSIAGPDSVYVRSIMYQGTQLSVLLKYNGTNGARIYGPYFEGDKLLKDSYELGYAELRIQQNGLIIVSDLILGGNGYAGRLTYDGVYTLSLDSFWESMTPKTTEMQITELTSQISVGRKRYEQQLAATTAKYEADIADVEAERDTMQDALATALAAAAKAGVEITTVIPTVSAMPTRTVLSGFSKGSGEYGSWSASANRASQSDGSLFYAKYVIPLTQTQAQVLYTFSGRVSGSGYVGYGLHFFATGNTGADGYGFGKSYLVWLTRDPDYYGSNNTYLQVYESFDDVKMIQVASVSIPDVISSTNQTEVLYDRSKGKIDVRVNGEKYLDYEVSMPLSRGNNIALRTLGSGVVFTQLTVKAK